MQKYVPVDVVRLVPNPPPKALGAAEVVAAWPKENAGAAAGAPKP